MGEVMKMVGAAAVAMALWIGGASAEDLTAASSRAIVERQFDAFARDDASAAYALAAPTIKDMFSDADHFMAMVRDHYAPVYRHRSAEFGAFKESSEDEASLEATLVDQDNVVWTSLYTFRRAEWRLVDFGLRPREGGGERNLTAALALRAEGERRDIVS